MSWAELHVGLLEEISKRLTVADYVRFGAVCKPWRSEVGRRPHHLPRQFPWLMLEYELDSDYEDTDVRYFYSILEDKIYHLKMPTSHEERCCGSSHGWLALVGLSPSIRLLNPLTGDEVLLPPMTTFPGVLERRYSEKDEEYEYVLTKRCLDSIDARTDIMEKIVLSSNPTSNGDCVVLAYSFMYEALAFCRPGEDNDTFLDDSFYFTEYYCLSRDWSCAMGNHKVGMYLMEKARIENRCLRRSYLDVVAWIIPSLC